MTGPLVSSLSLSLGAIEVGVIINFLLYGVSVAQCYIYFSRTSHVPPSIRLMVTTVWVVDTMNSCFIAIYLYRLTVTSFGDLTVLAMDHWSLGTSAFFNGFIGAVVQGYFAYRIHVLSRTWLVTILSWIGSFMALVLTTMLMAVSVSSGMSMADFSNKFQWAVTASLVLMHLVDCINTVALCIYFRIERTGSSTVDGILNKMFLWTIETGLVTALAALLMLVFSLAVPNSSLWVSVSIFYAKLYSNSLMATLNGRESLRVSRLGNDDGPPPDQWTSPTLNPEQTQVGIEEPKELKIVSWNNSGKSRSFGFMFRRP